MCVRVHGSVLVGTLSTCEGQVNIVCLFQLLSPVFIFFFFEVRFLSLELPYLAGRLDRSQGSSCLPSSRITGACHCTQLIYMGASVASTLLPEPALQFSVTFVFVGCCHERSDL